MRLPLHVFEPRYRRLVKDAMAKERLIAVPRLKPGYETEYYESPAVFDVCGVGRIVEHTQLPDGRCNIILEGLWRARLLEEVGSEPYRIARTETLQDLIRPSLATASALKGEMMLLVKRLLPHLSQPVDALEKIVNENASAAECTDALSSILVSDPDQRQWLLEQLDPVERMTRLISRLHDLLLLAGANEVASSDLN